MATSGNQEFLLIRNGSPGLEVLKTVDDCSKFEVSKKVTTKPVRCHVISTDGNLMAYGENNSVKVIDLRDGSIKFEKELDCAAYYIKLSPKSTTLVVWYPFRSNI